MKFKIVSFESIVQDVADATGITDLRNREPQIRRMIARAEAQINPYSGFMIRKKVKYYKGSKYFDGKNFKKPEDFVELDSAGCCDDGICPNSYYETSTHVVFCDKDRPHVILTYWALNCDGRGNPVTTETHRTAVVSYIVFMFYNQMTFLNKGHANMRMQYKHEWEDYAMAARGYDAFPSEWRLEEMHYKYMASQSRLERGNSKNKLVMCECYAIEETENPGTDTPDDPKLEIPVYWGMVKGASRTEMTNEMADGIVSTYEDGLDSSRIVVDKITLQEAINGFTYQYGDVGYYFFIIDGVENNSIEIFDLLSQSMGDSLEMFYDSSKRRLIFYSEFYIAPSNIYFKFLYNEG